MNTNKRKPRLHELLAVEQERKGKADAQRRAGIQRFTQARAQFTGIRKTFRPFSIDEEKGETPGERQEAETRLVITVPELLEEIGAVFRDAIDVSFQIDDTNTRARADIVVDGEVLAEQIPATFLLQLEKRLKSLQDLLGQVPTFDPVKRWEHDLGSDKAHVFRADPVTTIRKQRARRYNVMVEATPEHPAQVDIVEVDEPTGEIKTYEWSGMLSPAGKAALLTRVARLILAVKTARSRANAETVDTERRIGDTLLTYLFTPIRA